MDWKTMAAPWLRVEADTDAAHAPVREALMARAALQPGQHVLDIGPGAGISLIDAAASVGPAGRVTGIELSPPLADRARERVGDNVEVLVGDAGTHPFGEARFDAVISLFGTMFFADPVAAFTHIRRAMKPGGTLTFACWGPPAANPWFGMPGQVAATVFGPGQPFDPDGPGPMAFGECAKVDRILGDAGWAHSIDTQDIALTPRGSPDDVAAMNMIIGAASRRLEEAERAGTLTPDQRESVRAGMAAGFAEMMTDDGVRVPAQIHIVHAEA